MRVELLPWQDARAHAATIRFAVFVEEQGVPAEIELDEHDAACVHAVAYDGDQAVGTGRLLPDGHIGRMAVLKEVRNRGVGALVLTRLIERAKEQGFREVVLSAQVQAARFYRRHGFVEEGPEYMEAGIRHRAMRRAL
jgi:predicted GNAT family N-acyltransferase